jgi:hypothetical protein
MGKSVVAILCAVSFFLMSLGAVSRSIAADTWETWPNKTAVPGIGQDPATDASGASTDWETWPKKTAVPGFEQDPATDANGTANAEDAARRKPSTGKSYGTIGWIALGIAAAIGIGIAAGAGGGGDGGNVVTNPGHH